MAFQGLLPTAAKCPRCCAGGRAGAPHPVTDLVRELGAMPLRPAGGDHLRHPLAGLFYLHGLRSAVPCSTFAVLWARGRQPCGAKERTLLARKRQAAATIQTFSFFTLRAIKNFWK